MPGPLERLADADGDHVVGPDQGGGASPACQKPLRQLPGDLIFIGSPSDSQTVLLRPPVGLQHVYGRVQPLPGKVLLHPLQPLFPGQGGLVDGRGEEGHLPVAQSIEMLGQQCAGGTVAQLNGTDGQIVRLLADEDHRRLLGDLLHDLGKAGQEGIDDPSRLPAGEGVQIVLFHVWLAEGVADDRMIAPVSGAALDRLGQLAVIGIGDGGREDQEQIAPPPGGPGLPLGLVAQGPGCGQDPLPGRAAEGDLVASVEDEGDAGLGDAGQPRHIAGGWLFGHIGTALLSKYYQ